MVDIVSISGPIVVVLTLYQLYGLIFGFIIKQLFWLPHRFRYGIYVAAGWGNYGDIRQSNFCVIVYSAYLSLSQRRLQL
jgi:auxin efflux carrier family protein